MKRPVSALVLAMFLTLSACTDDPLDVNLSGLEVQLDFKRLDQDLFELNPAAGQTEVDPIKEKYGDFLRDYCEGVLRIGSPDDPSFPYSISQFITDENMQMLYDDVQAEYASTEAIQQDLNRAFSYFHYHFPDSTIPEVVFNISALNYAIVATPSTLAIGLDMFLGADHPIYSMVGLPQYMVRNMKREQIVPQAMKGWLQSMYETQAERKNLLEHMIFEGKILYALDATLRDSPDSVKIAFTSESMQWCQQFEGRVWAHLIETDLLYTTKYMDINKWINQAPFVSGIPKDSPGRLGQWVGWQIVRKYMAKNPETTLEELMTEQDAQLILTGSTYKPKINT